MSARETIWKAQPHTIAKIRIIEEYLKAWFPIIGRYAASVIYIDGFCGPGQYLNGEKGSPIAAIETALNHKQINTKELVFLFIDSDGKRIKNLKTILDNYPLPDNFKTKCVVGNFKRTLQDVLSDLDDRGKQLAPSFLFVDPFGIKEVSYNLLSQYMSHNKCEIMVNLMIEWINRFIETSEFEPHLDDIFGTDSWRYCINQPNRIDSLIALYESQLRKVARFVWSFEMKDVRNKTKYILFFGTNHIRGLDKMKDAMWKLCPTGDYIFSDRGHGQITIFDKYTPESLATILKDLEPRDYSINELENHVIVSTPFRKAHLRRALNLLEKDCHIIVQRPGSTGFPKGSIIRFPDQ